MLPARGYADHARCGTVETQTHVYPQRNVLAYHSSPASDFGLIRSQEPPLQAICQKLLGLIYMKPLSNHLKTCSELHLKRYKAGMVCDPILSNLTVKMIIALFVNGIGKV